MKKPRSEDSPEEGRKIEAKRQEKASNRPGLQVINESVLAQAQQDQLRLKISQSKPYRYGVINNLVNDDLLRQARDEIMEHLHFTEKETDIYKVNQTGDLANLSGLDAGERALLHGLAKVREGLYSPEFRRYLSYVTDSGPLSGSVQDLSVNLYTKGSQLLTHDDVIGTRRISYILYLTPPDDPWQPKWGGALRLYPTVRPGTPEADFSEVIPPKWNQLAFFKVQPGHSFHDVEEVYVDKERLSISGWFHIPQKGEEGYEPISKEDADADENATLAQLTSAAAAEDYLPRVTFDSYSDEELIDGVEELDEMSSASLCKLDDEEAVAAEEEESSTTEFQESIVAKNGKSERKKNAKGQATIVTGADTGTPHSFTSRMRHAVAGMLDEGDIRYLKHYINSEVLDHLSIFRTTFGEESLVQIDNFLCPEFHSALMEAIDIDDLAKTPRTEKDIPSPWKLAKPPHIRRYMYLNETAAGVQATTETSAAHVPLTSLRELMKSPPFARLLGVISSIRPTARYTEARRFRPGHDYTLATTSAVEGTVLEAVLSVTPSKWSDNIGGYDLIMMADENADDPAVYRGGDDDGAVLFTSFPASNQLTLILRDPGLLRFIKYVSHNAPGSRWDVTGIYTTDEDDSTEHSEEINSGGERSSSE